MNIRIIPIYLPLLVLLSCADDDLNSEAFRDDPAINTLNGTWIVTSFEDHIEKSVIYKTQQNSWGFDIVITFDDTTNPNNISGKNTTNTVFGKFSYTGPRRLELSQLASTYISQPEWGDNFNKAMSDKDVSFKINQTNLRIYYDNNTKSVTLAKQ